MEKLWRGMSASFRTNQKRNAKGSALLIFALMLIPLLSIIALAFDLGRVYLFKKELQNAVDMASLAALRQLALEAPAITLEDLYNTASITLQQHSIRNLNGQLVFQSDDIQTGAYDFQTRQFTPIPLPRPHINAVRIALSQSPGESPSLTLTAARVFGINEFRTEVSSISATGNRNVILAMDNSNLVDDSSYKPLSVCPTATTVDDTQRNFRASPKDVYDPIDCLGGNPQPAWDVFAVTMNSLEESKIFNLIYFAGYMVFGKSVRERVVAGSKANNVDSLFNEMSQNQANNDLYRSSRGQLPSFASIPVFFGGDDPPSTGYYLNTGAMIHDAVNRLANISKPPSVPVQNVITIIEFGVPNCGTYTGSCEDTATGRANGKVYTLQEAVAAANQNIIIHGVFYSENGPTCNGLNETACNDLWYSNVEGYHHLADITSATGGRIYHVRDAEELGVLFPALYQEPPLLLVDEAN